MVRVKRDMQSNSLDIAIIQDSDNCLFDKNRNRFLVKINQFHEKYYRNDTYT